MLNSYLVNSNPINNYLLKVNSGNPWIISEICSKLTIKTPERRHLKRSSVFTLNFEQIPLIFLVIPLMTLNK